MERDFEPVDSDILQGSMGIEISDATFNHLRHAQWPVIESIARYLGSRPPEQVRGYVESPTGSGKTVMFTRLLEEQRLQGVNKPTLIVTYTKQLVEQTVQKLIEHGYKGNVDSVVGWRPDKGINDVLVTTYAGFTKHVNNERTWAIDYPRIRQVIFDEAHHLQGESSRRAAGKMAHAAFIGFSATPDYDAKRLLSNFLPDNIHTVNQVEAVHEGLIAPYKVVILDTGADMSEVTATNGGAEYDIQKLERAINLNWRNTQVAKFYVEHFNGQRALFNTSTVQHAMDMNLALAEQGVAVATVHDGLPMKALRSMLEEFKAGKIQAMTQARLISEGYDDPSLSLVFNVSPTLSKVRAKQRARGGRIDMENPRKVMLVVECLDADYRVTPLLYGHPDVTDAWECYKDEAQRRDIERLIGPLVSFDFNRVMTDVDQQGENYGKSGPRWKKQHGSRKFSVPLIVYDPVSPACRNYPPEVFFLERGGTGKQAKRVCASCVEVEPCLDMAVTIPLNMGIWGGASQKERRKLRRVLGQDGLTEYIEAKQVHIRALKEKYI